MTQGVVKVDDRGPKRNVLRRPKAMTQGRKRNVLGVKVDVRGLKRNALGAKRLNGLPKVHSHKAWLTGNHTRQVLRGNTMNDGGQNG